MKTAKNTNTNTNTNTKPEIHRVVIRGQRSKDKKYIRIVKHVRGTWLDAWKYVEDNYDKLCSVLVQDKTPCINVLD